MTVYATYFPEITSYDFYRYNAAGVLSEPLFPSSGVTYSFPSGTEEGDVVILLMSIGTGATFPSVTVVDGEHAGNPFNANGSAGNAASVVFYDHVVHAGETQVFVRFLAGGVTPVTSPAVIWICRIAKGLNGDEETSGPRYRYWNTAIFSSLYDGSDGPDSGSDTSFDPDPIRSSDSSLLSGVPDGIAEVKGLWIQGMALNDDYEGTDPDQEDYEDYALTLPTVSGWTLLDQSSYLTGSLVETAGFYWQHANADQVQFPTTTVPSDAAGQYRGHGDMVTFLDYDYNEAAAYLGLLGTVA